MTLEELAVNHPYYAHDNNYYSNEPRTVFETMSNFLDDYEDADIDMNLLFRWDVYKDEDDDKHWYRAQVIIIGQRKGKYVPCVINNFDQKDVERFVAYAQKHKQRLMEIWLPL